ncbi:signal peptide peptidase-like 2A [Paramacrobiotus metropolitanus]|uniref:signal peptide peptidase-like 2A n=1 Tax=Paramacrobiotus metropolitanus TaxID=2943436 RepID=UPI002445C59F|nr:signal peptide peptidase-like 2A [Paramacrobiotus metropolitanus]XP_055345694.1 signal peptide peptidase-like 2A [Paramacrobiotus metropolitanus]
MSPSAAALCACLFAFLACGVPVQVEADSAVVNISYRATRDFPPAGSPASPQEQRLFVSYCAAYNPDLSRLPPATQQEWRRLKYVSELDLCDDLSPSAQVPATANFSGQFLAGLRSNCSASEQGSAAEKRGALGLLIGSTRVFLPGQPNASMAGRSTFPVLVMKRKHLEELEALPFPDTWQIAVHALEDTYSVDGSGICLIVLALLVIGIGSYRSGTHRLKSIEDDHLRKSAQSDQEATGNAEAAAKTVDSDSERASVSFGPIAVVVFALFMAGLLVLMYFFYEYLVFVFIALFTLGATSGMYECFRPLLTWTDRFAYRISSGRVDGPMYKCCGPSVDVRGVLLLLVSLSLSIVWLVFRNASFSWILLDLLGSFLLISVLSGIQLPSLKACSIFLCLLFVYDVFFVFITPLLTKDGQSVMIQVATGGGGYDPTKDSGGGGPGAAREVIPAAFKIPHNVFGSGRSLCEDLFEEPSYSLLGFGDVMVPGFLLSYLRSFELVNKTPPVYFLWGCIAYLVSLVVTTVALILMRTGQPALLYIVPILLLTVAVIAWRRKEWRLLWTGNLSGLYSSTHQSHGWSAEDGLTVEDPSRRLSSSFLIPDNEARVPTTT